MEQNNSFDFSKIENFLGKKKAETELENITVKSHIKEYSNGESYHSYPEAGISLLLNSEGKINSIYTFFNDKRYRAFQGKLPYNLNIKLTNGEVVGYLGEPNVKSGGKLTNITLNYKRLGVEFEFYSKVWEVGDAPLCYVCVYEPDLEEEKICGVCRKKSTAVCSRCKKVFYCGKEHQNLHWRFHKILCEKI